MTNHLADIIGPTLANDLYHQQACDVHAAIAENENGVRRVAAAVIADPNVTSPTAAFLSRLKRGQHRTPTTPRRTPSPPPPDEPNPDALPANELATRARNLAAQIRSGHVD